MEYSWPSSVNVANFVTVRPDLRNGEERSMNFNMWKEQMVCLMESQDVAGFINGEIAEPQSDEQKLWRRSDRLVKGWILGSIGTDVLQKVCKLQTARHVWLELDKIFNANSEIQPQSIGAYTNRDFNKYLPLYNAAICGDWETANTLFFQNNISETEARIWMDQETALHVAAQSGRANDFVRNLVRIMRPEALTLRDAAGYTALHSAAVVGNTEAARAMLEKYPELLYMLDHRNLSPVSIAATCHHKDTFTYLLSLYESNMEHFPFEEQPVMDFFIQMIGRDFYDVALQLLNKYPYLAGVRSPISGRCALSIMAIKESVFSSREGLSWWERLIYYCVPPKQHVSGSTCLSGDIKDSAYWKSTLFQTINGGNVEAAQNHDLGSYGTFRVKDIKDTKELHKQARELAEYLCREMKFLPENDACAMLQDSIFKAAGHGISEIVEMIIDMYPCFTAFQDNPSGWDIIFIAVKNRFEKIFNLTYSMSDRKHLFSNTEDNERNNLMHLCATLAPPHRLNLVPGAALQMQRELQWFNEIQRFVIPTFIERLNKDGKTAKMLFTEQHQELKEKGEKWMKDTATACSIATALIATVVFAAAFTVPGGVSSESGNPVFSGECAFVVFATTNAASLFTSITSLLMFLSILTSRYAEQDFLHVLPQRLCLGLLSLFISVIFMLIAFSAALYLEHRTEVIWFILPVATFGWLPVASFVLLQFPLLMDVIKSTYGPGIFGKKTNRFFY